MLHVKAVREIGGTVALPACPDFLLPAGCMALAARKALRIGPVTDTPLCEEARRTLSLMLDVEREGDTWRVAPKPDGAETSVVLPDELLRYRDLTVFLLLALDKTVILRRVGAKRLESWQQLARRAGCSIEAEPLEDGSRALTLQSRDTFAWPGTMEPDAVHALLGLALGLRRGVLFEVDYQISSPLRHLLPAVGYDVTIRSETGRDGDEPAVRRPRFLRVRKRTEQGPTYSFTGDFTKCSPGEARVTLPGDDLLGDVVLLAKALVFRGSLVVENVPLEPWANGLLNLMRKMGCRPGIQETVETSLGKVGMVQLQKFEIAGRKTDCIPLYQYGPHLPAMAVLSCFAQGQSVFRGLAELRGDEPDGIEQILECIRALGCRCGGMQDGMVIEGAKQYDGFDMPEEAPAPLAGACAAAALKCIGASGIEERALVRRWPEFASMLDRICEYRG